MLTRCADILSATHNLATILPLLKGKSAGMKTIVTTLLTALPLAVAIMAPAAAHQNATTMLRDAAVNHDLEKAKQQFEKLVKKMDASARATYQQ